MLSRPIQDQNIYVSTDELMFDFQGQQNYRRVCFLFYRSVSLPGRLHSHIKVPVRCSLPGTGLDLLFRLVSRW